MDELLSKIRSWTPWAILKALPFDGGPSSTRMVVLSVNFGCLVVLVLLAFTLRRVCLQPHPDVAIAGVLAGVITGMVTGQIGFAMSMQKARYDATARMAASAATAGNAEPTKLAIQASASL